MEMQRPDDFGPVRVKYDIGRMPSIEAINGR